MKNVLKNVTLASSTLYCQTVAQEILFAFNKGGLERVMANVDKQHKSYWAKFIICSLKYTDCQDPKLFVGKLSNRWISLKVPKEMFDDIVKLNWPGG